MTEVFLSERAVARLAGLDTVVQKRIKEALRNIEPERELARLVGEKVYNLRVGDYRVIVDWDQEDDIVFVLTLGHRRNIYDRGW